MPINVQDQDVWFNREGRPRLIVHMGDEWLLVRQKVIKKKGKIIRFDELDIFKTFSKKAELELYMAGAGYFS